MGDVVGSKAQGKLRIFSRMGVRNGITCRLALQLMGRSLFGTCVLPLKESIYFSKMSLLTFDFSVASGLFLSDFSRFSVMIFLILME